jgi:hypothetical protein
MVETVDGVRVQYGEALIREAVRTFVWRRFVIQEKLLWSLAAAMLVFCAWRLSHGDRSWVAIVAGAAPLLVLLFVLLGWVSHLRASLNRFKALGDGSAEFAFDAESLRTTSAAGQLRLPWTAVKEVWTRPKFWLLFTAPNQWVTMPTQNVPPATLDCLRGILCGKVIEL